MSWGYRAVESETVYNPPPDALLISFVAPAVPCGACPTGYSPSSVMPPHHFILLQISSRRVMGVGDTSPHPTFPPKVEVSLGMKCHGAPWSPAARSPGLTSFLHPIPPCAAKPSHRAIPPHQFIRQTTVGGSK